MCLTKDGQFEMSVNEAGRDELIALLNGLDRKHEHFHMAPEEFEHDCAVAEIPYRTTDRVLSWGKVLFRPDDWDREHFPHVMTENPEGST